MRSIDCRLFSLAVFGILILELIAAPAWLAAATTNDLSDGKPIKNMLATKPSGKFRLEIWELGNTKGEFSLTVVATGTNANRTVTIQDEALSISDFLDQLTQEHFPVHQIRSIYIPATQEVEVKRQLANAALASDRWRSAPRSSELRIVELLAKDSNCYSEIGAVFATNHLKISAYSIENLTLVTIPDPKNENQTVRVPDSFTMFIRLENLSAKK